MFFYRVTIENSNINHLNEDFDPFESEIDKLTDELPDITDMEIV